MSDPRSRKLRLPAIGLDYHFLEWDAESDHTVVLLHGFLDVAWTWETTARAGLAKRFHLVAPDFRGHGDSDRVGKGGYYYFMDYVADLRELIPQVARKRVSLVGHSMGGSVAAYYAGTYPADVARLALLEGTGPPDMGGAGPERVNAWIASWQRVRTSGERGYATLDDAAAQMRKHDALLDPAVARQAAERGTRRGDDGRYYFKHDPLHATPGPYGFQVEAAEKFWRRVSCPTLLVEGEKSQFRHPPAEAERRAACFKDVRRATVPGAGHAMQRHQPAALAELLTEFLSSAPKT